MYSIFQVKNAMEYGVKGMLLYGDPIDFAKEGTVYSNRCEIFGLFLLSFPQNKRKQIHFFLVLAEREEKNNNKYFATKTLQKKTKRSCIR